MEDRCLFLQSEISCMFVDDFLVLPSRRMLGNIYRGVSDAVQRHTDYWFMTY